jgi:HSP20 family protein
MSRTMLLRRRAFPPVSFLPSPLFPSMTDLDDFAEKANEIMRSAFDLPDLPAPPLFPAINLVEGKDEFMLTAELPGLSAKDVTIEFAEGILTVRGEKEKEETKEEEGKKFHMWERRFGTFQRSLPFPGGINEAKIAAEFTDGVLTVHLPKKEELKANRRTIAIAEKK